MRLANGIIIDKEKTFGVLKFSALRREVHIQNEDGTVSEEIKERTYDLKCKEQGRMIQVSIPASVPLKEFDYNTEVEIINPVADTVATATFQGADVDWYIKADDIVLKKDFFLKQIKGRGYVDTGNSVISEFYTPLVPKGHDFLKEIGRLSQNRQDGQAACEAKDAGTD